MGKKELQCLFIGEPLKLYKSLASDLSGFNLSIQSRLVKAEKTVIVRALKKQRLASIIFISDNTPFSLEVLSDAVWQYAPDSIITILTEKTVSTSLKKPFNNTQFSKLHYSNGNGDTQLYLQYLIQTAQLKWEFRRCKRLLGIAEKRCQWLVDSSNEAIAFITRDLHLYANTAYLGLFGINSVHELPAISVKELIISDERDLFNSFIKEHKIKHNINHSLLISLRKRNGGVIRANLHVIPSVFKGNKCLQLWVHPLSTLEAKEEQEQKDKQQSNLVFEETIKSEVLMPKKTTPASILRGIIKRKEATISAQKLVEMKNNEVSSKKSRVGNHMLSLKVPVAQRIGIDNLLFESGGARLEENRQIFWDKVKLTRLLQILIKKKSIEINLFVKLSEASICNKQFSEWFLPGLKRVGEKAENIIFLLPIYVNEAQVRSSLHFANELRSFNSKIALDDFSVSEESLTLLKHVRPDYVRLSLPWVRQIEGDDDRELALGSFIRQLESKGIQVIAPCGFSRDMRKLFALSGVSFCQERTLKTG